MTIRAQSQPDNTRREFTLTVGTRTLTVCLCVLLAAFCLSSSVRASSGRSGMCWMLKGTGTLDSRPGQPLSRAQEVPASGVIRIPSPSRFAFIIIRYSDK